MAAKDFKEILGGSKDKSGADKSVENSIKIRSVKAKRPTGMSRELFNLISHGPHDDELRTMTPNEKRSGHNRIKASIQFRQVMKWRWVEFTNEARKDGLRLKHWEREDRKRNEPYIFAKFGKNKVKVVDFSDEEFNRLLKAVAQKWTLESTRHLFSLCERFDLRWPIVVDRFDREAYGPEFSMEDMKQWYYDVTNVIKKERGSTDTPFFFDAEHERRRKTQLIRLFERTDKEMKEEDQLKAIVKKLEVKRKERDRRTHELQRLINAVERSSGSPEGNAGGSSGTTRDRRRAQKNVRTQQMTAHLFADNVTSLRYPEFRSAGPHLRSLEMKLPTNLGQKKFKAIETAAEKYQLLPAPHAHVEIVRAFNDLRSSVVHAQELRNALQMTQQDLESLQRRQT